MNARTMTRMLLLAAGLLGMAPAFAQEIGFTAAVDRNAIAAGDQLRLTITLTNARERFEAPDLGGLVVVQGPFESSSFNYVNGRMSSTVSRTWVLTATKPGRYTIGPAKARIGNGVIQTEPITIEVSKGSAPPPAPAEAQGQQRGDPNLFISLVLSKSKAYVGEQVLASYYVYNRYPNVEIAKVDPSKPNGFWVEELSVDNAPREQRVVNGLPYNVTLIKQQLLLPQRSGTLRIEPLSISFIVNRSFFSRGTPVDARSNAAELTALPLPAGAPAGFNGAVGELELTVKADRA